jgi:excisionase family DNA binding protein
MKTKKTTVISHETHEELRVSLYGPAVRQQVFDWCPACTPGAPLLTPEEAAQLAGVSVRALYRFVEDGRIHFKETPDGLLLVCVNNIDGRTFNV